MKSMSNAEVDVAASKRGEEWLDTSPGEGWIIQERGVYTYGVKAAVDLHFTPTSVMEQYAIWVRNSPDRGSKQKLTRVYRDALSTPQQIELRVEIYAEEHDIHMVFEMYSPTEMRSKVVYRVTPNRLSWTRFTSEESHTSSIRLSKGTVILPLMRNFLGAVIHEVTHREEGRALVLVPELTDPHADNVFTPMVGARAAALTSSESDLITIGNRTWDCLVYSFVGGPYDDRSRFWVCSQSQRLIRYVFEAPTGDRWFSELADLITE